MRIKNPEISILLPFFNSEFTLERALKSISKQTYPDFECILINNNSTDQSVEIAKKFCDSDIRFKLFHEEKQGIVHALNHGLYRAKGAFIARMDADDWCFPDRLEQQLKFLHKHKDYGVVAGTVAYIAHKQGTAGFERYVTWSNSILDYKEIYNKQFIESPIIHPTVMWRKIISDTWGTYSNGDFPEDYELWLRWLAKGVKFHKLPKPVIKWFDADHRLSRTDPRYSDDAFCKVKSKYLATWLKDHNTFHPQIMVWGASKISRKRVQILEKEGIVVSGFIDISRKRKLGKTLIYYKDIPPPSETFILVYLREESMRSATADFLAGQGYIEGENFLLVS